MLTWPLINVFSHTCACFCSCLQITCMSCRIEQQHSFLDFITGGWVFPVKGLQFPSDCDWNSWIIVHTSFILQHKKFLFQNRIKFHGSHRLHCIKWWPQSNLFFALHEPLPAFPVRQSYTSCGRNYTGLRPVSSTLSFDYCFLALFVGLVGTFNV